VPQEDAEGHVIACHIPMEELRKVEPVIKLSSEYTKAEA